MIDAKHGSRNKTIAPRNKNNGVNLKIAFLLNRVIFSSIFSSCDWLILERLYNTILILF